ncbi:MAG TPA: DUF4124 domain-containing protein [Steroidobacteraceae bacterium]|nr:DUF4124 domain-containing protein [Steroidobacteraceae bacterium]
MKTISTRTDTQGLRRRTRAALAVAAVVALGALALPAAAAVYKWVDPQGRIHYSDRPPPPEGKLLSVDASAPHGHGERGPEPSRPAGSSLASASVPSGPVTGPAANPEAVARLRQEVASDVSNAQADQCKQAQDRYQNYVHSRRLYKEGPDKERIYLTDQELETERLQAKHEVDELCGPGR